VAKVDWKDTDGTVADVQVQQGRNSRSYSVVFTYKVDGSWYGGTYTTGDELKVGNLVPVRYDPKNPERNDLVVKETRKHWIVAILIAIVIGPIIVCNMY
jgi:hypothetical protein